MTGLPDAFLGPPLAHRGLHGPDVPENSRAAIIAAVESGYGIELDLQLSSDEVAMVFHDHTLDRMTSASGPIRSRTARELSEIRLPNGEGIPTFSEILKLVGGACALLVEMKDQSGTLGPGSSELEAATASALEGYRGPVAVMSFNPHAVAAFGQHAPDIPRGLTSDAFDPSDWPDVPTTAAVRLRNLTMYDESGACFISHDVNDLSNPRVQELRDRAVPVLCWTVRSEEQETEARRIAQNITFEGYRAQHP